MKRLTGYNSFGGVYGIGMGAGDNTEIINAILKRLAAYEDAEAEGRLVVLPCKVGTHLWRVTHPYRAEPKATEYVVKNFRTVGKKHVVQLEVQVIGVPVTNWMEYKSFFTTREEAEEALGRKA